MALTKVSRGLLSTGIVDNSNATAITIDSSENVGIGTSSPTTLLELKSTSATAGLSITGSNAHTSDINMGDTDDINIQRIRSDHSNNSLQFTTNNAERLRIDSSGAATFSSRVSATGSANAASASHIPALLGSGSYGGGIATRDGAESGWYQQTSGADWHFYHNRTVASQTPESKKVLSFNASGAATFSSSVTATGGLFSSANPLDVRMGTDKRITFFGGIGEIGSVAGFQSSNTAGNALAGFGIRASSIALATSSNTRFLLSDNGAITTTPSSGGHAVFNESSTDTDFRVESNDNANMIFVDGGNNRVGIGKVPATHPFEVSGGASFDSNLLVNGSLASTGNIITNHLLAGASSSSGAGAIGVINTTGTANCPALNVMNRDASTDTSNRFIQFYANVTSSTATPMGGIVGNGASNVQFAALSDVREKQNIEALTNSLDKITSLNPVEFDWITSGEHCKAGFIAQEVEEVFPEFVVENMASEGQEERKGLTGGMTGGIVVHLVKAIQEQQTLIETLTARIAALEE